ncbi:MAG: hypothetical protein LKI58_11235 [Actinomyces sp.]|jgi:hypothetical protein|nr:hypothetical protein [Actinomyces sp.]MCI1788612.1 hypothetical protein [Actinomyces sp.]MCI1829714.1 hypothetical protein [Actinomyces sp.]
MMSNTEASLADIATAANAILEGQYEPPRGMNLDHATSDDIASKLDVLIRQTEQTNQLLDQLGQLVSDLHEDDYGTDHWNEIKDNY